MTDAEQLAARTAADPHSYLGAHPDGNGGVVVRAFRPAARAVHVLLAGGARADLAAVGPEGVFEGKIDGASLPLDYELEVEYGDDRTFTVGDPYRFLPTLGEIDLHLVGEGRHEELYEKLGAHVIEHQGVVGTAFAVWAPSCHWPTSSTSPTPTATPSRCAIPTRSCPRWVSSTSTSPARAATSASTTSSARTCARWTASRASPSRCGRRPRAR